MKQEDTKQRILEKSLELLPQRGMMPAGGNCKGRSRGTRAHCQPTGR